MPATSPFANDALGREDSAKILTQFLARISDPYVLALDSPWGTGKTTFIRMWLQSLKNDGVPALYFNAWESDFSDDPFVAMVGELSTAIGAIAGSSSTVRKGLKRTKEIAVAVAKRAIPVAIRIGTAGAIDLDAEVERELAQLAGEIAKERIEDYEKAKNSIAEFRESLAMTVQAVRDAAEVPTPLVFFIDELDRCRPTYAIALLEKAKHLFSVPGVVFVLALDKSQLLHSIRSVYGSEFDARGYLRRFIDIDYRLPEPSGDNYVRHLFDRLGFDSHFGKRHPQTRQRDHEMVQLLATKLIEAVGFSLREQIQCVSRLLVVLNTIPDDHKLFELELVSMVVLREWKPELFDQFVTGHASHKDVLAALAGTTNGRNFLASHPGALVEAALAAGASELAEDSGPVAEYRRLGVDETIDTSQRERAILITRIITDHIESYDRGAGMKHTLRRIALGQSFITRAEASTKSA